MTRARAWVTAACLVLALAGCGDEGGAGTVGDPSPAGDAPALDGKTFESTEVRGYALVPGSVVSLTFEEGCIAARAGCNTLFGGATWTGGALVVEGPLADTEIGCEPALQAQDEWLAALLTSSPALSLAGSTLTLGDDTNGMTMAELVALPLAGTAWQLESLITADAVSSTAIGSTGSFTLEPDGTRVSIDAGCNTGGGPVTVASAADPATGTMTFGPLATTRKLCPDDVMTTEQHVLEVLTGEVEYTVDGRTLTLTNGDKGLGYRAAPS